MTALERLKRYYDALLDEARKAPDHEERKLLDQLK